MNLPYHVVLVATDGSEHTLSSFADRLEAQDYGQEVLRMDQWSRPRKWDRYYLQEIHE